VEELAFASRENRAMLRLNRLQFIRLHRERSALAGIVVCTFGPDFERQAERIHRAVVASRSLAGQLLRMNRE
jgi:hypothetical protein